MQEALDAISKGMKVGRAATQFQIPRSTLRFRLGPNFRNKTSKGPKKVLSTNEEDTLVQWLIECQKKGFPKTALDLQSSVKAFIENDKRPYPSTDNCPGRGWCRAFFKRHPQLVTRTPEGVTSASACVSEADIRGWFASIETLLKEEGLFEIT